MEYQFVIIGIILVVAIFAAWFVFAYRGMRRSEADVKNAWGSVKAALESQFDLFQKISEYSREIGDRELFDLTRETMNVYATSWKEDSPATLARAENAYAKLKHDLQAAIRGRGTVEGAEEITKLLPKAEKRFKVTRKRYNEAALKHNTVVSTTPVNILGKLFSVEESTPIADANGPDRHLTTRGFE